MGEPTYDRKLDEIAAAEEVVDAHLLGFVQKLQRRGCHRPCPELARRPAQFHQVLVNLLRDIANFVSWPVAIVRRDDLLFVRIS